MRLARVLKQRMRSLLRRDSVEASLRQEIELHLEQIKRELMAGGMSERQARLEARRQFGPPDVAIEECRDMRRVNLIEDLNRDIVSAFRSFKSARAFALTAVVSLGYTQQ